MCCAVKYRRSFSKSVSFHYSSQWWDFLCCCCETVSFSFTRTGVIRRLPSFAFVSLNSTRQCSFWSGYKRPCGRQNSITNLSASYTSHLNLYWFTVIWICIEFVQITFKCDLCDGDYVGSWLYSPTTFSTHWGTQALCVTNTIKGTKVLRNNLPFLSSVRRGKFECLVYEMLFIQEKKP